MKTWHLLIDEEPLPGSLNMAVDEHLFRTAAERAVTFLRFYRWRTPTVSLGHSQDAAKVLDVEFCRAHGIACVRRITGGKLVLHHREVTYAVASSDSTLFTDNLRDSYKLISQALIRGLELMGLRPKAADATPDGYAKGTMPCFASPARDEIELGGRKIIGSAQKRAGPAFLQHGSIPLRKDDDLLAAVSAPGSGPGGRRAGMTSLSDELGRSVEFIEAVEYLVRGFSEFFGIGFEPFVLGPDDRREVAALEGSKYRSNFWTLSGSGLS